MTTENLDELWNKAKNLLKQETTEIAFVTWIQPLELKSFNDNLALLVAKHKYQKDTIDELYKDLITNTFNFITNKKCRVEVKLESDIEVPQVRSVAPNRSFSSSGINPKYTFYNFVVGSNNKFAQAAAMGVAENPGSKYNPFFLYGGVGLGKTHLMHAIGNHILEKSPNTKVLYVTSENYTNELVNSLSDKTTDKFREKYRNIDVLLIDDIQFISNKKATQEEFFHTFNTLYESGKQIVISSDRPPKDIALLEERLKSRFEWNVMVDIINPDYETRLAILRKKTQQDNIIIDDEILETIATRVDTNVRELEGTLNKLIAKASLTNSPITMAMAQKAIDEVVANNEKVLSAEYIQDVVGKYYNIAPEDIRGPKRSNDVTRPRQIAMYLCRNVAQMSMPQIGKEFGNRDHSTVIHACNKIEKEINEGTETKLIVESVKNLLLENN